MSEPQYVHDCSNCEFLGRMNKADLYRCGHSAGHTYVVRTSSEGPDYSSLTDYHDRLYNELKATWAVDTWEPRHDVLCAKEVLLKLLSLSVAQLIE